MLTKRIIPCLDVTAGRVVKGTQFLNLKDAGDPIELARFYNEEGADELVFLDITASSDKRAILLDLVRETAREVFIPFTVGGGIRDIDTIQALLLAGADKVSINTSAIHDPTLIKKSSEFCGSQCIVVAIDAKQCRYESTAHCEFQHIPSECVAGPHTQWEIYTHGGRHATGIDAVQWASFMNYLGAGELLVTSMDQDGQQTGYDIELTQSIRDQVNIPVIASGGAGNCEHISDALHVCDAALLASLLHFKQLRVADIKRYCHKEGLPIRP